MLLKNIWLFARQHSALFVLLILTQLAAIVGILLSYGITLNNQYNLKAAERDFSYFAISSEVQSNSAVDVARMKDTFPEVLQGYEEVIENVSITATASCEIATETNKKEVEVSVGCIVSIYDGKYGSEGQTFAQLRRATGGDWFSDEALNNGLRQCIVCGELGELGREGLFLEEEYYEIIACEEMAGGVGIGTVQVHIPLEAMADKMKVDCLMILFTRPLTHVEYSELYSRMVEVFGPLPEYEDECSLDIDEKATMHTMIINSVLIALLASFTVCLLYRYLLEKRKVMTAVYEICGCTGWRAAGVYIGEMLLLFACTAVGGMLVFWYVIKPYMEKSFPWFSAIYKGETAFQLVGVYVAVVLVVVTVMICGVTKKQPKEILREG